MAFISLRHKSHHLNLKSHHTLFNFSRLYSSSSSNDDNGDNQPPKASPFSSYFAQIKPKSDHQQSSQFDEIRKNLSEFRNRSPSNTPRPNPNPNPTPSANLNSNFSMGNNLKLDKIRESLQNIKGRNVDDRGNNNAASQLFSLNSLKQNLEKTINTNKSRVFGGSLENLPLASFGKEIREKSVKKYDPDDPERFNLIKVYNHAELGKELRELRPDVSKLSKNKNKNNKEGEEGWFTLSELQGRLAKLNEIELERNSGKPTDVVQAGLKRSLESIQILQDQKKVQRLDIVSQPGFMFSSPGAPQEHLIEKYFHPDNMSAAEKLKLELKKVREEFKMSETDCGSTRVQIAQLTTEIHHLSSVLHKKDKHSRKGLHGKVQRRKKLLKYLRRTDWESYCFVLTKLGLRDNPDYKN